MRTLDQFIASLPAERRAKVTARGKELIAEEMALRHVREARKFTQKTIADTLGMDQAGVSKLERRADMLLSTLRNYVEAMGGKLRLTAEFADGRVDLLTTEQIDNSEVSALRREPSKAPL